MPTTVIRGREDGLVPPFVRERLARLFPRSELHWIPGRGHAPQIETPDAFHTLLPGALDTA